MGLRVIEARRNRSQTVAARSGPDWRGWIALAWVVFWGCAYALMMLQARAPQAFHGIKMLARAAAHSAGVR